jgi:hypothetical protein
MRLRVPFLGHSLLFVLTLSLLAALASAQAAAQRSAPRGRLPPYYKDLVSPEQRDEIYRIQAKYNAKIDELEAEIERLKAQRDAEVEKVLTPQQRARLQLLRAEKGKADPTDAVPKANKDGAKDGASNKSVFPK